MYLFSIFLLFNCLLILNLHSILGQHYENLNDNSTFDFDLTNINQTPYPMYYLMYNTTSNNYTSNIYHNNDRTMMIVIPLVSLFGAIILSYLFYVLIRLYCR